jgi:ClpP class serine protease
MQNTYELFTDRVMEMRGEQIEDIDRVAKGRIFLAQDALELGMVDRLGGLQDAMADAAERGGLGDDYEVVVFPDTSVDPLAGLSLPLGQSPLSLLAALPDRIRTAFLDAAQAQQLLEERPVILMTPWRLRVD